MYYLGQQIVRAMQQAGYDTRIHCCYRSPAEQDKVFQKGYSQVQAFGSAHQYLEAVDIIHRTRGWDMPPEFWDTLQACAQAVARKHKVSLTYGHDWAWKDSAHIQMTDWKTVKAKLGETVPSDYDLAQRFKEVLPKVWKQHECSTGFRLSIDARDVQPGDPIGQKELADRRAVSAEKLRRNMAQL